MPDVAKRLESLRVMSSLAFTIDWGDGDDKEDQSSISASSLDYIPEPRRAVSDGQVKSTTWNIDFSSFSSVSGQTKSKKQIIPKFLRDQKQRSLHADAKGQPSDSSAKPNVKPATSPLKARGTRPVMKSATSPSSLKYAKVPTKSKSSDMEASPKKQLPAIRKPLLPASPTKKPIRSPDVKSQSESLVSYRTPNKALKGVLDQRSKKTQLPSSSPRLLGDTQRQGRMDKGVKEPRLRDTPRAESSSETKRQVPTLVSDETTPPQQPRLAASPRDMGQRKVLDLKRWYCMCRPQYSKSCGISSVVSCWNYLFSTLGNGNLAPITQEEALAVLGFEPPFGEICFGHYTGNTACMRWFQQLCGHFGTSGCCHYFYKPVGRRRTAEVRPSMALEKLQEGLKSSDTTFIYHCYNHYFCPIGYEQVPKLATHAYRVDLALAEVDTWILIGDSSPNHPAIHCKRWEDVVKDLTCEMPKLFNIRHTERGIISKNSKKTGKNLHCIMAFKKLGDNLTNVFLDIVDSEDDDSSHGEIEELDNSDSEVSTSAQSFPSGVPYWDTNKSCNESVGEGDFVDRGGDILPPVVPAQSDTFTNFLPTLCDMHQGMSSSDSDSNAEVDSEQDVNDNSFSAPGVRRSSTFTKERPTLNVQQVRPLSSDLDSDCSLDEVDCTNNTESTGMKRSSTYTKDLTAECAAMAPLVDANTQCHSVLKKSDTFTENKCSVSSLLAEDDLYANLQNIDLDATLISSDYI